MIAGGSPARRSSASSLFPPATANGQIISLDPRCRLSIIGVPACADVMNVAGARFDPSETFRFDDCRESRRSNRRWSRPSAGEIGSTPNGCQAATHREAAGRGRLSREAFKTKVPFRASIVKAMALLWQKPWLLLWRKPWLMSYTVILLHPIDNYEFMKYNYIQWRELIAPFPFS